MDYETRLNAKAKSLLSALQKAGIDFSDDSAPRGILWRGLVEETRSGQLTKQTLATLRGSSPDVEFPDIDPEETPSKEMAVCMATVTLEMFFASAGDCELLMVGESVACIHALVSGRRDPTDEDWAWAEENLGDTW